MANSRLKETRPLIYCSRCSSVKEETDFTSAERFESCPRCKQCRQEYASNRYRNPSVCIKQKQVGKIWRTNNKEWLHNKHMYDYHVTGISKIGNRRTHLRLKYNMTLEDYDILLHKQMGVCAICHRAEWAKEPSTGIAKQLAVDHNHTTGMIRGLLCTSCNTTLGKYELLKDSISQYLKENSN